MSELSPVYSFLPWARQGLSRLIAGPPAGVRASIPVELQIRATPVGGGAITTRNVPKNVALFGPGDVVGVESKAIIRTEPRHGATDFEPNYLPCVEFYEEDFPWRYTPTAPSDGGARLPPWIVLVVMSEEEFTDAVRGAEQPLASITVNTMDAFPPEEETWGFAHVHVNGALSPDIRADRNLAAQELAGVVAANRDRAYSRLMSPRRLLPNTPYHAFVMPAFESGRLAGLNLDPNGAPSALHCAWAEYAGRGGAQGGVFPYYHRWYFRTGGAGDFESLVRRLRPQQADPQIGRRDMDVARAGAGVSAPLPAPPGGTLKLGGALQAPRDFLPDDVRDEIEADETWFIPRPHPLQQELAKVLNRADDFRQEGAGPDPLITPPIYGAWHARQHRLLLTRTGEASLAEPVWLHDLNLDPRFRAPAGMGVRVVQKRQEDYMAAAWRQIGDVLKGIRKIRLGWMAMLVAQSWNVRHLAQLASADPGRHLALVAPMKRRVVVDGVTLLARVPASRTPAVLFSAPLRRILRPNGRVARAAGFAPGAAPMSRLAERVDAGELKPAPDKVAPAGAVGSKDVADGADTGLGGLLAGSPVWLLVIAFLFLILIAGVFFILGPAAAIAAAVVLAAAFGALVQLARTRKHAGALLSPEGRTPQAVDALPMSPNFTIAAAGGLAPVVNRGGADSVEAQRFKAGLKDAYAVLDAHRQAPRKPPPGPLGLRATASAVAAQIDPRVAIPRYVYAGLKIPPRIADNLVYEFDEPMSYPRIDDPMYEPLSENGELFVPNLSLLRPDTVTLLETNQPFIEAYMMGLNDEFGRELLWREYPTDQRGSYFRQFWDVRAYLDPKPPDPDAQREKYYDIAKIHLWRRSEPLGSNDNRQSPGSKPREEAVLAVRGQLLKRYPTTLVYAQAAAWQTDNLGRPLKDKERVLVDLTDAERRDPPHAKVRTPLYAAKVKPDIYFFGFDLDPAEAMGDPTVDDKPGWFLVFEERPGEPRFGADQESSGALGVWNDLAWSDIAPANAPFIPVGATAATLQLQPLSPADIAEKQEQRLEDDKIRWDPAADAGAIAYMLFQAPSRVAFHARELLTGKPT